MSTLYLLLFRTDRAMPTGCDANYGLPKAYWYHSSYVCMYQPHISPSVQVATDAHRDACAARPHAHAQANTVGTKLLCKPCASYIGKICPYPDTVI